MRETGARSGRWGKAAPLSERLAFSAVGVGSLLAFVLCVAGRVDIAAGAAGSPVSEIVILTFLATSVVVGALRAASPCLANVLDVRPRFVAIAAGALMVAGACLSTLFTFLVDAGAHILLSSLPVMPFVAAIAGVAMGTGVILLAMAWGELLFCFDATDLVRVAAGAVCLAGVWCAMFRPVGKFVPVCSILAFEAIFAVGSYLFAARFIKGPCDDPLPHAATRAERDREEPAFRALLCAMSDGGSLVAAMDAPRVRDLYRMLWIPLVGVLFCAFISGLTWDPIAAYEGELRSSVNDVLSTFGGAVCAALALALCARAGDGPRVFGLLSRVVQQVALLIVLVVPALQQSSAAQGWALTAFEAASIGGFALLTSIAFVELVSAARCVGLRAGTVLGGVAAAIAAVKGAGMFAIGLWGASGRTICLVLEALFLAAIAISYALRAHGDGGSAPRVESPEESSSNSRTGVEARCVELIERAGLSPREAEVLFYLGRGHGSSFIAEELDISENTVRTHVRHIYEKVGVTSREELLALVND